MRVNVYTEELLEDSRESPMAEIVTAEYTSSRTGLPMKNYGLRVYFKSARDLHYIPGRDDDRSAVTFWCGASEKNVARFLESLTIAAGRSSLQRWHDKTIAVQEAAEKAEDVRR